MKYVQQYMIEYDINIELHLSFGTQRKTSNQLLPLLATEIDAIHTTAILNLVAFLKQSKTTAS
jgi:hypothetical protein